jgi:hypothetical protein
MTERDKIVEMMARAIDAPGNYTSHAMARSALAALEQAGYAIVPREPKPPAFKKGDTVVHRLNGEGTVTSVDRDGTWVHFPREPKTQRPLVACYDRDWFRLHPDMLAASSPKE